jgi:hypothetical protein
MGLEASARDHSTAQTDDFPHRPNKPGPLSLHGDTGGQDPPSRPRIHARGRTAVDPVWPQVARSRLNRSRGVVHVRPIWGSGELTAGSSQSLKRFTDTGGFEPRSSSIGSNRPRFHAPEGIPDRQERCESGPMWPKTPNSFDDREGQVLQHTLAAGVGGRSGAAQTGGRGGRGGRNPTRTNPGNERPLVPGSFARLVSVG